MGTLPSSVSAQWDAATAEGWEALSALAEDTAFRKRLKKVEATAAKAQRLALRLLESVLGAPMFMCSLVACFAEHPAHRNPVLHR